MVCPTLMVSTCFTLPFILFIASCPLSCAGWSCPVTCLLYVVRCCILVVIVIMWTLGLSALLPSLSVRVPKWSLDQRELPTWLSSRRTASPSSVVLEYTDVKAKHTNNIHIYSGVIWRSGCGQRCAWDRIKIGSWASGQCSSSWTD